jgi:hypothetical protein
LKNKKIFSLVIVCALVFSMFVASIPLSQAGKPQPPTGNPGIAVMKVILAGNYILADESPGPIITSGPVQFVIAVMNTGDVDLSRVKLTDTSLSSGPVNIGTLAAGGVYLSDVFTEEWVEGIHESTEASASGVYGGTTYYSNVAVAWYTCSPATEPAPEPAPIETLTSPNMVVMDSSNFGQSVAVGGGYIAIGAPEESLNLRHGLELQWAGRVYIYDETTRALVKTLQSPNGEEEGHFGSTVAISGDYLIVGAIGEDSSGVTGAGRVYVYSLSHLRASPIELVSSNPTEIGRFGWSIAGDGTDVFVGAPDEGAGMVYSYDLATGDLNYDISPEFTWNGYGSFGSAVAVTEGKLYVGDTVAESSGGRVYIYEAATGDYSGMLSHISEQNGYFGCRIGVGGSYLFVGASGEASEGGPGNDGQVYVYSLNSEGTATYVRTLASPNPTNGADFGGSLASDGTYVVIGAPSEIVIGNPADFQSAGRAYIYSIADLEADPVALVSPNSHAGDLFGDLNSVAIHNGLIVIGASGEFVIGYDNGRAYIYSPG